MKLQSWSDMPTQDTLHMLLKNIQAVHHTAIGVNNFENTQFISSKSKNIYNNSCDNCSGILILYNFRFVF